MAVQTIKATIQMRQGNEEDFDPDKMTAGEWAVSKDVKYVRMCFKPGLCLRMATYEAFEQDMKEIQLILATCQDIQAAVEAFEQLAEQHASQAETWSVASKSWAVGGTGTREGEDINNSKYWSQQSKNEADRAKSEADRASTIVNLDIDSELSETSSNPVQNKAITNFLAKLEPIAFTGKYSDLTEKLPLINNFLTTEAGVGAADAKAMADLKNQMDSQNNILVDKINEINGNLAVEEIQLTNLAAAGSKLYKSGHIYTLVISMANVECSNGLMIGSIPSQHAPLSIIYAPIVATGNLTKLSAYLNAGISINTSGHIQISGVIGTGNIITTATWIK